MLPLKKLLWHYLFWWVASVHEGGKTESQRKYEAVRRWRKRWRVGEKLAIEVEEQHDRSIWLPKFFIAKVIADRFSTGRDVCACGRRTENVFKCIASAQRSKATASCCRCFVWTGECITVWRAELNFARAKDGHAHRAPDCFGQRLRRSHLREPLQLIASYICHHQRNPLLLRFKKKQWTG